MDHRPGMTIAVVLYQVISRPIASPHRLYSLISTKTTQVHNKYALAIPNLLTKCSLTIQSAHGCFIGKRHASDYFVRLKVVSIEFNLRKKSVVCVLHTLAK